MKIVFRNVSWTWMVVCSLCKLLRFDISGMRAGLASVEFLYEENMSWNEWNKVEE